MSTNETFDLSDFVLYQDNEKDKHCLQHAIDGVNMAASDYPDAWNFVAGEGLIQANHDVGLMGKEIHPIAKVVFAQMEQDGHSGATASYTIHWITKLAKDRFQANQSHNTAIDE